MDWKRACGCVMALCVGTGAGAGEEGGRTALRMGMEAGAAEEGAVAIAGAVAACGRGSRGNRRGDGKAARNRAALHRVGWDWGDSYFISSSGVFFHLMRPCPASDNTVSRSVVRISRAW